MLKQALLPALLAAALAAPACSGAGSKAPFTPVPIHPFLDEAVLGRPDAPVTILEYASTTCHGCWQLHTTLMPEIKTTFIDTGKVKLVYRTMPTPPADVSAAGAAIARCAGKDRFFAVIADLFADQPAILSAAASGNAQDELVRVGSRHGLSRDEVRTCINDKTLHDYLRGTAQAAPAFVTSTPTLIVNGDYVAHASREALFAVINQKLAEAIPPAAETAPEPTAPKPNPN